MFAFISWLIFGLAVLLWVVIFVVFVVVKIRNTVQRKKYSVKQDGDVSTKYESRGALTSFLLSLLSSSPGCCA